MLVSDITIEVRSLALGRLGQIDMRLVSDMKIIKRFNNVGSWELSLPAEDGMARELAQKGRGLTVEGPMFTLMSGRVLSWTLEQTTTDSLGNLKFIGVDDMVHLADGLAWPQPSNPDVETQNVGHDIRTGVAETVIKGYVSANIGPTAPSSRRIPELVIAADQERGNVVTGRARFDPLGVLLSQLGAPGVGNLGFDIMQVDDQLIFDVFEPEDKSALVRMDIANDTLDNVTYGVSAPSVTRAIVAGQGEMEDRRIIQVTDSEAGDAESEWGRKIEQFLDRRDVEQGDDTELVQTGAEAITTGGRTMYALSVKPSDDQTMVYGVDWYLGDIVSVIVDGDELAAVVTEAIIMIGANGVTVGATVGDAVGFDFESRMIAAQKDQETRLAFLEKNVEKGTTVNTDQLVGDPLNLSFIPNLPSSKITSGRLGPLGELITDCNDAVETGSYYGVNPANGPLSTGLAHVEVYRGGASNQAIHQDFRRIFWNSSSPSDTDLRVWSRVSTNSGSTWSPWTLIVGGQPEDPLPDPLVSVGNATHTITAAVSTWQAISGQNPVSFGTLLHDLLVKVEFSAILHSSTGAGYARIGVSTAGGLVTDETEDGFGHASAAFSPFSFSTQQTGVSGFKSLIIPAGSPATTFQMRAMRSSTNGVYVSNYSLMQVIPLRWV